MKNLPIKELLTKTHLALLEEREALFSWLIVSFCFGILFYFALDQEPDLLLMFFLSITLISLNLYYRNSILYLVIFFTLGVGCATYRTYHVKSPMLNETLQNVSVSGRITHLIPTLKGQQLTLERLYISPRPTILPTKIKIAVNTPHQQFAIGDVVRMKAILKPPSQPLVPRGYDFARQHFYERIGATGFSLSKVYVLKKNQNILQNYIANLRLQFSQRIKQALPDYTGPIAASLIIGEQSAIDKQILLNMRNSGLSHILSVSGLHLSLVSIICFFCTRLLLSLSPYIAQKYDTKKIAAYISLIATLFYLLISGMQIAAIRSYIMVLCVIVAILFDRQEYAVRSVCVAAFIMLIITPEAIMHPSFQMSFFAVIALVSGYELYLSKIFYDQEHDLFSKIKRYLIGSIAATFIAGLATAPFAIYYFNQYSNYSMLANLAVAPITSFILMPAVVITCLLYPFGLEKIALKLMALGIKYMVFIANWVSHLPNSTIMLANMNNTTLFAFAIGILWLSLWQSKLRLLGFAPILYSCLELFNTSSATLMIDQHSHTIFIRSKDHNLVKTHSNKKTSQFITDYFNAKMQTRRIYSIDEKRYQEEFDCQNNLCNITKGQCKISFHSDFQPDNIIKISCPAQEQVITLTDLEKNGSYYIYLSENKARLESVADYLVNRPWRVDTTLLSTSKQEKS